MNAERSRRGWTWALPAVAALVWVMCIGYPALAALEQLVRLPRSDIQLRAAGTLFSTSIGWALAVALGAMLIGWPAGRVLGKVIGRNVQSPRLLGQNARATGPFRVFDVSAFHLLIAALTFIPICIPSYVVFYAWWQSWPAESAIYRWVVANQHMQAARQATLYLGMLCWSWPLVSWCVAAAVAQVPAQREELLQLDGVGPIGSTIDRLRTDGRALALGGLLVFLATLANTTNFDLAEVFTFANELRAAQALGANPKDVLIAALPIVFICMLGAVVIWRLVGTSRLRGDATGMTVRPVVYRTAAPAMITILAFAAVWTISVVLPIGLFIYQLLFGAQRTAVGGRGGEGLTMFAEFAQLYRWSVANTVLYAAISGLIGAVVAVGCSLAWMDARRGVRLALTFMGMTWLMAAVLPGTVIGVGLNAAYNREPFTDLIAMTPAMLNLVHLTCFGFIAVLLARWLSLREPRVLADLRQLDGVRTLRHVLQATRPRMMAAALGSFMVIFVLALSEIPVTAMVHPPYRVGAGPLSLTLLNDMHYQRPQTVMVAVIGFPATALIAAAILAAIWVKGNWWGGGSAVRRSSLIMLGALFLLQTGCAPDDPDNPPPLKPQLIFGASGTAMGQFAYPRAIAADAPNERLFIIDKQARVQRVGFDGKPQHQWQMPDSENGKPTGVSIAPDGRVFVADTHYFRVIAYDENGHELMRFGEFGRGPRQFIYVTDVAFGPNGRLYVSEYGGNDRVQVFDESGRYLFEFSDFGAEHGKLSRPQALAFNAAQTELFISDACNHRVVVVDPNGGFLRSFGTPGRGVGQMTYPYGLTILPDGSVLVAEFGNNRLQRFSSSGKNLGIFGTIGRGPGQLQYPWGVASARDRVFVLDSGNNRVQVIRTP